MICMIKSVLNDLCVILFWFWFWRRLVVIYLINRILSTWTRSWNESNNSDVSRPLTGLWVWRWGILRQPWETWRRRALHLKLNFSPDRQLVLLSVSALFSFQPHWSNKAGNLTICAKSQQFWCCFFFLWSHLHSVLFLDTQSSVPWPLTLFPSCSDIAQDSHLHSQPAMQHVQLCKSSHIFTWLMCV